MAKVASGRWAVVVKDTGVVSDIKLMQGGLEPELRNDHKDQYELVQLDADDEVAIGMVRGGKGKGGFSWPEGHDYTGSVGAIGLDGDKSRGTEVPKAAKSEGPTKQPEDMKPKPAPDPAKAGAGHASPKPVTTQAKATAAA